MSATEQRSRAMVIFGPPTKHIGLLDDLRGQENIDLVCFPDSNSKISKAVARVRPNVVLLSILSKFRSSRYRDIFVVDSAFARMDHLALKTLRRRADNVSLVLLNSIRSSSLVMAKVRDKLSWFNQAEIYTFDAVDAQDFGLTWLPPNYYSAPVLRQRPVPHIDCYFAGGLKGHRSDLVLETINYLDESGLQVRAELSGGDRPPEGALPQGSTWRSSGWVAYTSVLERSLEARCLIEVLQRGQSSQTLRYFEAVANDRLLLTNNPNIVDMPYYDPQYMRVFTRPQDIDVSWLREASLPHYGYAGDFSPRHMPLLENYIIQR